MWLKLISQAASSGDAALLLSLLANGGLALALVRVWRAREEQQRKILRMLAEILRELVPLTSALALKSRGSFGGDGG